MSDKDTGDLLEVPESERKTEDEFLEDEVNDDEFAILNVPAGEYVELSTASPDEPIESEDEE